MPTGDIRVVAPVAALPAWHARQALQCLAGICYCTMPPLQAAASRQSPRHALLMRGTRTCNTVCGCMQPN